MGITNAVSRAAEGERRPAASIIIAAAWSIVAIAAALQALALVRLDGRTDTLRAVLGRVSIVPLWALATPLILRSARRLPVVRAGSIVPPAILAHLLIGSAFIIVSNAIIRIPLLIEGVGLDAFARSAAQGVAEYYPPAIVVYGVIVAIGHALVRPPATNARPSDDRIDWATTSVVSAANGHLTVRQWNRVHLVPMDDIDYVEAEDNYVVVHAASRSYRGRDRISEVEAQLDGRRFVRIHRSTIVQVGKIREVQPLTHGDHAVILRDGKVLRVARSRRPALESALGVSL